MGVSVVSQIIQDAVAVSVRAFQRIGLRRLADERRPELAFVGGIDSHQGERVHRRARAFLDDQGHISPAGDVSKVVVNCRE